MSADKAPQRAHPDDDLYATAEWDAHSAAKVTKAIIAQHSPGADFAAVFGELLRHVRELRAAAAMKDS